MDSIKEENIMYKLMEIDELVDAMSSMLRNWNCRGSRALDNIDFQIQDIVKEIKEDLDGDEQKEEKR